SPPMSAPSAMCRLALNFDCTNPASDGSVPALPDQAIAFGVDLFRIGEEIAPDASCRRKFRNAAAERLDGQPAVIAERLQGPDRLPDLGMAPAGRAPVVFRDVDVGQGAAGMERSQGSERVLLLNVGVKRVVENAEAWLRHALGVGNRLLAGIEQVRLE